MLTPEEAMTALLIELWELKDDIAFGRCSSDVLCGAIRGIEGRLDPDGDLGRALAAKAVPEVGRCDTCDTLIDPSTIRQILCPTCGTEKWVWAAKGQPLGRALAPEVLTEGWATPERDYYLGQKWSLCPENCLEHRFYFSTSKKAGTHRQHGRQIRVWLDRQPKGSKHVRIVEVSP